MAECSRKEVIMAETQHIRNEAEDRNAVWQGKADAVRKNVITVKMQ